MDADAQEYIFGRGCEGAGLAYGPRRVYVILKIAYDMLHRLCMQTTLKLVRRC